MAALVRRACAALLVASLATACGGGGHETPARGPASTATGGAVPVVVDTDLAVDDLVALAFLLSSPEADVRAVTVSGTGEVRCPQGLKVIRSLLAVTGDEKVPVACGRSTPLAGDHAFPTEWRDTSYGFPYVLPTNKGGNITLRVKVAELPASWRAHLRVIID